MARYEYEVCAYYSRKPLTCIMDFLDFQKGEDLPEPAPAYLHLTFSSSSVVTVYFDPSINSIEQGHNRGCEVFVCRLAAFYGDCIKERVIHHMPFVSFDELKFDELYYATLACFSRNIYGTHSPWIMFITPMESKPGIPGAVERLNSGIETHLEVHDGFNLDLIWWFSLVNGSAFPVSHVKLVEVFEHKKYEYLKERTFTEVTNVKFVKFEWCLPHWADNKKKKQKVIGVDVCMDYSILLRSPVERTKAT
ncbi:hypothetical protein Aduo_003118 [Ancylostoma duodenale]